MNKHRKDHDALFEAFQQVQNTQQDDELLEEGKFGDMLGATFGMGGVRDRAKARRTASKDVDRMMKTFNSTIGRKKEPVNINQFLTWVGRTTRLGNEITKLQIVQDLIDGARFGPDIDPKEVKEIMPKLVDDMIDLKYGGSKGDQQDPYQFEMPARPDANTPPGGNNTPPDDSNTPPGGGGGEAPTEQDIDKKEDEIEDIEAQLSDDQPETPEREQQLQQQLAALTQQMQDMQAKLDAMSSPAEEPPAEEPPAEKPPAEEPPAEEPDVPQLGNDLPAGGDIEEPPTDTDNVEPDVNNPDTWEKSTNEYGQELVTDPETGDKMVPGSWLHKTLTDPAERQSYFDMLDNRRAQLDGGETTTPEPREGETTIAEPGQGDDATDVAATNRDPSTGQFGSGTQGGIQFAPNDSTSIAADDLPDKHGIISYPAGFKDKDGKPKGGQFRPGTHSGVQFAPDDGTDPYDLPDKDGVVRGPDGRFRKGNKSGVHYAPDAGTEIKSNVGDAMDKELDAEMSATSDPDELAILQSIKNKAPQGSQAGGSQEVKNPLDPNYNSQTGQVRSPLDLDRPPEPKKPTKPIRNPLELEQAITEEEFEQAEENGEIMRVRTDVTGGAAKPNMESGEVVKVCTGSKQGKVKLKMDRFSAPNDIRWAKIGEVYRETIQPPRKNLIADSIGRPGFMSSRWGENL